MEVAQKNAIGVRIQVTIMEDNSPVDISAVTTKQIVFKKPDGTVTTETATNVTDGTDGKIEYRTVAGFLNVAGEWKAQGYVVFPGGGFDGRSDITQFEVAPNLA